MKKLAVLTLTAACLLIFAEPVLATTTVRHETREVIAETLELEAPTKESVAICVLLDDPEEAASWGWWHPHPLALSPCLTPPPPLDTTVLPGESVTFFAHGHGAGAPVN